MLPCMDPDRHPLIPDGLSRIAYMVGQDQLAVREVNRRDTADRIERGKKAIARSQALLERFLAEDKTGN